MSLYDLKALSRDELRTFAVENLRTMGEDEALAILENPYCGPQVCQLVAQNQRLTSFYSVRLRLVAHRGTPQAHAMKFVHFLYWPDLLRLSCEVTVPAPVRRAIDNALLLRVDKLTLGERVTSARRCSQALIKIFLRDRDPKVFASLLINERLREDDLVYVAGLHETPIEHLLLIAADRKWSFRYAVRKALVLNPRTPRSTAASQLRFLTRLDRMQIHANPATSTYLRRCIERLDVPDSSSEMERIG